jgi:hypothetical protein
MGWIWYSGKACLLSGESGDYILRDIDMTIGLRYLVFFSVSGMSAGRLSIGNFEETEVISGNGGYAITGIAAGDKLIFTGLTDSEGDLFNGCIDTVRVFAFSEFSDFENIGCSPCINVEEEQDECLVLVTAENSNNALGFGWEGLTLKARIGAKFAKVEYDENSEELDDNGGDHITTYFDGKKSRNLQIAAAPIYVHDFLFMCKGVDTLKINGVEYSIIDKYPSITWNPSEKEGTVELKVRKKNYKLNKTNCG